MKNLLLSESTAAEIDLHVGKVIRDLGVIEPPIRLEEVRELLRLDRGYYSSTDESILREKLHRLKIAGQQVLLNPTLILHAVRKFDLKALYLPDRKRILLDKDLPDAKQRWSEAHEIAHSLLDWHQDMMLGDQKITLSPACHAQIETEANYGAGRLLFLQDAFDRDLADVDLNMKEVLALKKRYCNTITTTLWRAVEGQRGREAFGLVTRHPHRPRSDDGDIGDVRYFVRSEPFAARFSRANADFLFAAIREYCSFGRGPLGVGEMLLSDDGGKCHRFSCDTFFNGYDALTVGYRIRAVPTQGVVAVALVR